MFIKTALFAAKNTLLALPRAVVYGVTTSVQFIRMAAVSNVAFSKTGNYDGRKALGVVAAVGGGAGFFVAGAAGAAIGALTLFPATLTLAATFSAFAGVPVQTRKDVAKALASKASPSV